MIELSQRDARRLALAAQGFGRATNARVGRRALQAVVARLGCIQIDSVNVLARSHYLPFFSRLGAYDVALLDDLLYGERRAFAEYWAHEASIVDHAVWPLLRWRMARARNGTGMWGNIARINHERPDLVARVRDTIATRGAMTASEFENARSVGSWWGWSDTKRALEYLFWAGFVTTRRRRSSFEREYDLIDRVLPAAARAAEIDERDAQRELVRIAIRALGVATEADARDYFRLDLADARRALAELVTRGDVVPVRVADWSAPAYAIPSARLPRITPGSALLSPFDNLIWNRPRADRLFGFTFRLEIYTPVAKRVHGYYVLPYLLDGNLVARVDLKLDRANRTLIAHAVHRERDVSSASIGAPLREDLVRLAAWLGAEHVKIPPTRSWYATSSKLGTVQGNNRTGR